ncbi:iron complex transport system permease protein [Marinobacter daqiaonensis]|uniref:Iron complex transport system permease protein n=1 Tax=Marinobacter daqiaonensis TaxID=650891 RepID=A0A1I6I088_9GAMM|nr:Fe(3+)-hydroxamate ABC transporter permease FhuB [Marinobacter daqiaonensis]SFR60113.1 iron complex transport system permease protein [Marinobacter daqiaonensis]
MKSLTDAAPDNRSPAMTASFKLLLLVLTLLTIGMVLSPATDADNLARLYPALWLSESASFETAVLHYTLLPRIAVALLTGAALGFAGTLVQQVLRNPLAAPTTLGVAAGSQLVLGLVMLLAPSLLAWREAWAMLGGLAALGLVLVMGARRGFDPLTLTLCGLIVSLYLGAINTVILLFNHEQLAGLFIWGAGELSQTDWRSSRELLPHLLAAAVVALLLWRPLQALDLGTEGARSLGLSPGIVRTVALLLAVYLTALTVSHVGVVGFIGLAAPAIVKLLGARTLRQRLLFSALAGALLCLVADGLAQQLTRAFGHLLFPTGAATALLGGPVLLWVLTHNRFIPSRPAEASVFTIQRRGVSWLGVILLMAIVLASLAVTLGLGPTWDGWRWTLPGLDPALLAMRLPRSATALMAGVLLAGAGVIVQRLTRNPMASPELLGISTGAALGMVVLVLAVGTGSRTLQMMAGGLGGTLVLIALLMLSRRSGFSPQRLLLGGIALSALLDAGIRMVLAMGDTEAVTLLNWLAGSTWLSGQQDALTLAAMTPVLLVMALLASRWLDMLPLGEASARALGLPLSPVRLALLLLAALMTAAATLVVGPLSFVGLMAPHLARLLGYQRALPQMLAAFALGGLLMLWADWLARSLVYPYELPAGLVATLIGGGYFLVRLYRER